MNITPRDRCKSMFDGSVFEQFKAKEVITDPLKFKDQKKYTDRIKDARKKTGEDEAMLLAKGKMGRTQVVVAVQDFSFMGGSMGMGVGNAIIAACEQALKLPSNFIFCCRRCKDARRYNVINANAKNYCCITTT